MKTSQASIAAMRKLANEIQTLEDEHFLEMVTSEQITEKQIKMGENIRRQYQILGMLAQIAFKDRK